MTDEFTMTSHRGYYRAKTRCPECDQKIVGVSPKFPQSIKRMRDIKDKHIGGRWCRLRRTFLYV